MFVDRLAAAGQDEDATTAAREQIAASIGAGATPPGLRRLAEALAASVAEVPPAPRQPVDDPGAVVPAMRGNALVVLDDAAADTAAAAVTALVADGRRVIVAAETDVELDAVRHGVAAGRVLDGLPALPASELRELRRLLATSTPTTRARAWQVLPDAHVLPAVDEVRTLCERATRVAADGPAAMVPTLLAGVEQERRDAVAGVARCVLVRLDALGPRQQFPWEWDLLGHLIHTRHRPVFDRTQEDVAQAVTLAGRRMGDLPITFRGPLPADSVDLLCNYLAFLEGGGRTRAYFRASAQREVQPVLRQIRVADREPADNHDVRRVLDHLELGERLRRVEAGCLEMGVPAPRGPADLTALAVGLGRVAAAARSVGALRHDVLFLATDSPLAVPDVDTASTVAAAILDYADHGSVTEAVVALDRLADELAARTAVDATAPEHDRAVAALRSRDAAAYATAVEALGGARRERLDDARRIELLERLRVASPALVREWEESRTADAGADGLACFVRADALLAAVPPADTADVVVVLGAARLGVERLLLAAVAPRMVAVVDPDEEHESSPSLLSVLNRAAALVIRGAVRGAPASRRVVQLHARPVAEVSVGQAGA